MSRWAQYSTTVIMKVLKQSQEFMVTSVYARCSTEERLELLEEIETLDFVRCPWMVGGDFNVILNEKEKLGGLEFTQ